MVRRVHIWLINKLGSVIKHQYFRKWIIKILFLRVPIHNKIFFTFMQEGWIWPTWHLCYRLKKNTWFVSRWLNFCPIIFPRELPLVTACWFKDNCQLTCVLCKLFEQVISVSILWNISHKQAVIVIRYGNTNLFPFPNLIIIQL